MRSPSLATSLNSVGVTFQSVAPLYYAANNGFIAHKFAEIVFLSPPASFLVLKHPSASNVINPVFSPKAYNVCCYYTPEHVLWTLLFYVILTPPPGIPFVNTAEPNTSFSKRIMIVEDCEDLAMLLNIRLKREGWDTNVFTNPLEALQAFSNSKFDVLMTDQMMPEMTGSELIERVMKLGGTTTLFVIYTGDLNLVESADQQPKNIWIIRKPTDVLKLSTAMSLAIQQKSYAAGTGDPVD